MTEAADRRRHLVRRMVGGIVVALLLVLLLGLLVTMIDRNRALAAKVTCQNNLRALALLGTPYSRGEDGVPRPAKNASAPESVWPGTVPNGALKPDERLSWVVYAIPFLMEPAANTTNLNAGIDRGQAWNAGVNAEMGRTVLRTLQCPGWPLLPAKDEQAVTMYVGIAGVGPDAATLPLGKPLSSKAGAFRYDAATPLAVISAGDGLSNTLLFGVTRRDNGPWIRGGPSTVRPLLDEPPLLGPGGQFGGTLLGGSWFALCDGSVRWFNDRTEPGILRAMATIAGGKDELPSGD